MKFCVNDPVIVTTGADKGKKGTVMRVNHATNMVQVEGLNKKIRNRKANMDGSGGGRVEIYAPIHASNLMYIDPKTGAGTRLGYTTENGEKIRIAKKSGTPVPPTGRGTFTPSVTA